MAVISGMEGNGIPETSGYFREFHCVAFPKQQQRDDVWPLFREWRTTKFPKHQILLGIPLRSIPETTVCKTMKWKNYYQPNITYFFSSRITEKIHILRKERYKLFVTNSLNKYMNKYQVSLYGYAIMPNHIHCIVGITDGNSAGGQPAAPTKGTLSSFVNGFKSAVTTRINILRNMPGEPVWQRSFYDHVIRNERSLNAMREYILTNPVNWELDVENLLNL